MSSWEKPADENPNASRDGGVKPLASIIPADSKFKHPQNIQQDVLANVFIRTRGNGDDFTINEALSQIDIKRTNHVKNEAWFEEMDIEKAIYSAVNGQNCKQLKMQLLMSISFQCAS